MSVAKSSPFHRGEQAIQRRIGVRDKVEEIGRRFIRDHMPDEHRAFYQQLPFLLLGSVDTDGRPWASVLAGRPGFISAPDERTLAISATSLPGDPAADYLTVGAAAGLLGIDFESRRRNRMNGRIAALGEQRLRIAVEQSFGNCPMYIQARDYELNERTDGPAPAETFSVLDAAAHTHIRATDSFFIATHFSEGGGRASEGADVSHRGGKPGFVRIDDGRVLTWPDFTGNTHFNTLGNILMNPRAGLLFIDYQSGDLLTLTGTAEIIWEGDELENYPGAERLVRFRLEEGRRLPGALPLRWQFHDYSPVLEQTGTWEDVSAVLATREAGNTFRDYTVSQIVRESKNIRSFYIRRTDGGDLPIHVAGQFLPLELTPAGSDTPIRRTYTISNAPDGEHLRLSIKREPAPAADLPPGQSSGYFHDTVTTGTVLRALAPRGCFQLDSESCRPVVLLSAGVGITPMMAMLEQLVRDIEHCGPKRKIYFVHGARNGSERAFAEHLGSVTDGIAEIRTHIAYSAPEDDDVEGRDFDSRGRIDVTLLQSLLPLDDYDFYLCGPSAFMREIYDGLRGLNVTADRIHYEFFGPAARLGNGVESKTLIPASAPTEPISVRFRESNVDTTWDPSKGTLLDLAEAEGLAPPYSCRSGVCQTCATPVTGEVVYAESPMAAPPAGQALICCAFPKVGDGHSQLVLDL